MGRAIRVGELHRQDYSKAINWAIEGMHLGWFGATELLVQLYGTFFWYLELNRATQVIAAYQGDELVGVLLAAMEGEPLSRHHTGHTSLLAKLTERLQYLLARDEVEPYDEANRQLLKDYRARLAHQGQAPQGEILFLAANPHSGVRGVGSALLEELERREPGKLVFLYTDTGCTYQFYEHRGFTRQGERIARLGHGKNATELGCFLYSKRLPRSGANIIAGYR